jgi:hypothetical protein
MDVRKSPIPLCAPTDPDAAPIDCARAGSSVVFFGSPERISEGFAIALRAMGAGADILPAEPTPPNISSSGEEK